MTPREKSALIGGFVLAWAAAMIIVVFIGLKEAPWFVKLASAGFVPLAWGFGGALLAFTFVCEENSDSLHS